MFSSKCFLIKSLQINQKTKSQCSFRTVHPFIVSELLSVQSFCGKSWVFKLLIRRDLDSKNEVQFILKVSKPNVNNMTVGISIPSTNCRLTQLKPQKHTDVKKCLQSFTLKGCFLPRSHYALCWPANHTSSNTDFILAPLWKILQKKRENSSVLLLLTSTYLFMFLSHVLSHVCHVF